MPTELIEAAKIDGSSFPGIFFKIALPIMKPALAAQAALSFMGIWNDFLGPLIYLHTPEKQTIQVLIASMQAMYIGQSDYPMIMQLPSSPWYRSSLCSSSVSDTSSSRWPLAGSRDEAYAEIDDADRIRYRNHSIGGSAGLAGMRYHHETGGC
ncbi:maltose/maltodextrin ABC transporter, permease protein MalG [Paenibacillus sp. JCM 10914]|nr:maltose/maltodextrin ABC transporter, permease protein MalG [Paenibacillus sp. JCM 10914]